MRLQARAPTPVHRSVITGVVIARLERILIHFATAFAGQPRDDRARLLESEARLAQNFERLVRIDRGVSRIRLLRRTRDDYHDLAECRRRAKMLFELAERPANCPFVGPGNFTD